MTETATRGELEAQVAELKRTVGFLGEEFARLEGEHARYRAALRQIAVAESGVWGRIAQDALRPPREAEA